MLQYLFLIQLIWPRWRRQLDVFSCNLSILCPSLLGGIRSYLNAPLFHFIPFIITIGMFSEWVKAITFGRNFLKFVLLSVNIYLVFLIPSWNCVLRKISFAQLPQFHFIPIIPIPLVPMTIPLISMQESMLFLVSPTRPCSGTTIHYFGRIF